MLVKKVWNEKERVQTVGRDNMLSKLIILSHDQENNSRNIAQKMNTKHRCMTKGRLVKYRQPAMVLHYQNAQYSA